MVSLPKINTTTFQARDGMSETERRASREMYGPLNADYAGTGVIKHMIGFL